MIRTQFFGEVIRVLIRKPEFQRTSRMDPQNLNQIAPNKCLNQILVVLQQKGLKLFLNPLIS